MLLCLQLHLAQTVLHIKVITKGKLQKFECLWSKHISIKTDQFYPFLKPISSFRFKLLESGCWIGGGGVAHFPVDSPQFRMARASGAEVKLVLQCEEEEGCWGGPESLDWLVSRKTSLPRILSQTVFCSCDEDDKGVVSNPHSPSKTDSEFMVSPVNQLLVVEQAFSLGAGVALVSG